MLPTPLATLPGVASRVVRSQDAVRFGMAAGRREGMPDREVLTCIRRFERRQTPCLIASLAAHGPKMPVVVPRHRREADTPIETATAPDSG